MNPTNAGTLEYTVTFNEDVTALVAGDFNSWSVSRKEIVNTMVDELESSIALVEQISTDIAHDLKTPISRVFIVLEEALLQETQGMPVADKIVEARAELLTINTTFDGMMRLARIEQQTRRDQFIKVDLVEILTENVEDWHPVAEDKNQLLEFENSESDPVWVMGDRELLTQMLVNLISNAINHCAQGTHIGVSLSKAGKLIRIRVHDNGAGIPADERTKVFRRLHRLDSSRSIPGSGLGLSLVQAIARVHGATVTLSDNHPGLIVTVEIPG